MSEHAPHIRAMLHMLNAGLHGTPYTPPTDTDWQAVEGELRAQAVFSLPYPWLKMAPVPEDIKKKWVARCLRQTVGWHQLMRAQDSLVKLLSENRVPFVILKGAAAALQYPHPQLRAMGDVDFLVPRGEFDRVGPLLTANGYELESEVTRHHHDSYKKDGVHFELHRRVGSTSDTNETILAFFEQGVADARWVTLEGHTFPVLPTLQNGLVLLLHINQHLRSGLGLRQIIDWCVYVERELSDETWQTSFRPVAEAMGLAGLTTTVTRICKEKLGLTGVTWCDGASKEACDVLVAYLLRQGNLGHKIDASRHTSQVMMTVRSPWQAIKRLQLGGMSRWEAAKRHRILRPFAWIWQGVRVLKIYRRGRVSVKDVRADIQEGKDNQKLYDLLGLEVDRTVSLPEGFELHI